MAYVVNHNLPHRDSVIGLINTDNANTLVRPLELGTVDLSTDIDLGNGRWAVTVSRKNNPLDNVQVTFTKLNLASYMEMSEAAGDFNWYVPEQWGMFDDTVVIGAFKAAAIRAGINPTVAFDSIAVSYSEVGGTKQVTFDVVSYVWLSRVSFVLPGSAPSLEDTITTLEFTGFDDWDGK